MPRASGQKETISLHKGLITEASQLAFPENSTSDELNFVIDKDGLIRRRRKGLEFSTPTYNSAGSGVSLENVHYWKAPNLVLFVVTKTAPQQTTLRIHSNDSNLTFKGEVVLNSDISTTSIAENTNFITVTTSKAGRPVFFEYDSNQSRILVFRVSLYIRDFELVDDSYSITERPATLTDNHEYNLYNAGWWQNRRYQYVAGQPVQDPVTSFFSDTEGGTGVPTSVYPSNADIVAIGMSVNENGVETFRPDEVKNANLGNSAAPRGHYVYDINDFDRDARIADKTIDGTTSTTVTTIGSILL